MPRKKRIIHIPNIMDEINLALKLGYHRFILVVGDKNLGKSTLTLSILHHIFNNDYQSPMEIWREVFRHLCFTPRQFYEFYTNVKDRIDKELYKVGLDSRILNMDIDTEWEGIIEMVLDLDAAEDFTKYREALRIPAILIDDLGAHMNRQDVSIYYDPFFQQLFADLTLIRPYIACLLATAPSVRDVPRSVLQHVTDIIIVEKQGRGRYRKIRNFVKFQGKHIEGMMKMYDGDPIEWDPLPGDIYSKYEILRHLPSRRVSQKAKAALIEADLKMGYTPPTLH